MKSVCARDEIIYSAKTSRVGTDTTYNSAFDIKAKAGFPICPSSRFLREVAVAVAWYLTSRSMTSTSNWVYITDIFTQVFVFEKYANRAKDGNLAN